MTNPSETARQERLATLRATPAKPIDPRRKAIAYEISSFLGEVPHAVDNGGVERWETYLSLADTIDRLTSTGEAGGVTAIVDGLREDYETVRKWSGSALVAGELSKSETREGLTQLYSDLCGLLNSLGYYADQLEAASPREGHVEVPVGVDTDAEWELEQRAFDAANHSDVPEWAQKTVADLWRQYCLATEANQGETKP